jgi:hypothetical protein
MLYFALCQLSLFWVNEINPKAVYKGW